MTSPSSIAELRRLEATVRNSLAAAEPPFTVGSRALDSLMVKLLDDSARLARYDEFFREYGKLLVAGFVRPEASEEAANLLATVPALDEQEKDDG